MIWLALLFAGGVYPEAAPWGHAGAPGMDSCHACHWENAAEAASPRLSLDGLPPRFEPGERYALTVTLAGAGDTNGFQLVASAGRFEDITATTQANGASIRSVQSAGVWPVVWIAGDTGAPVRFWLAVNDANGDASEFGDRILLREFESLP